MNKVVVLGSLNLDIVACLEAVPAVGETVKSKAVTTGLGGKGANQAVAASRLGASVDLICAIGQDDFASRLRDLLAPEKLALHYREKPGVESGLALIDLLPGGDNIIRLNGGANDRLTLADVTAKSDILKDADILLLQNEIPLAVSLEAARVARAGGALVIMDPAPAPRERWGADILSGFDIITPNETETKKLLGSRPLDLTAAVDAATALCAAGARSAIITMGDKGVAWSDGKQSDSLVCPDVEAVDTVAAGDCFNGGLAAGLASGKSLVDAINFATHTAAIAVTRTGASGSAPYLEEVLSSLSQ